MIEFTVRARTEKEARKLVEDRGILIVGLMASQTKRSPNVFALTYDYRFGADPSEWEKVADWWITTRGELVAITLQDGTERAA